MRLYFLCDNCTNTSYINSFSPTRGDLAKEKGNQIKITCRSCKKQSNVHVNDLKAQKSKFSQIVAILVFFIGTTVLFWLFYDFMGSTSFLISSGGLIVFPAIIFGFLNRQEQTRVSSFNRYKVGQ